MASLEGWNFTIKLCPRALKLAWRRGLAKCFSAMGNCEPFCPIALPRPDFSARKGDAYLAKLAKPRRRH